MLNSDKKVKDSNNKVMERFPTGQVEAEILEKVKLFYAQARSWGMEEQYYISFTDCKVFGEYRYPVGPNSLLDNFVDLFLEMAGLLNSHI